MTGRNSSHPIWTACVAVLSTTLFVPSLAARCLGCCDTSGCCAPPKSFANRGDSSRHKGACCQNRKAPPSCTIDVNQICCTPAVDDPACDCSALPYERAASSSRIRNESQPDVFTALPSAARFAIETEVFVALSSAHRLAAAAPSIPPRILYCSWLI